MILIGLVVIGIVCYLLFFKKPKPTTNIVVPPGTKTAPIPAPVKTSNVQDIINTLNTLTNAIGGGGIVNTPAVAVNDSVVATTTLGQYNGSGLVSKYQYGGSDGHGNITSGVYVGVVQQIIGNSVQVRSYTNNPIESDQSTDVTLFWVSLRNIKKQ